MPFDTKSHLINYHTEGQGENTEVPFINMPTQVDGNVVASALGGANMSNMSTMEFQQHTGMSREVMNGYYQGYGAGQMEGTWRGRSQMGGSRFQSEYMSRETNTGIFDGMALPYHYLGQYYSQKTDSAEAQAGKDSLLVYDFEGQGSRAGSLGSCTSLAQDNDLQFLDDLDPKFKTLAEICGAKFQTEVRAPPPSAPVSSHTAVSSVKAPGPLPQLTPLPQPVPQPTPTAKSQTTVQTNISSSSSVVKESSDRSQAVTVTEVNREAPRAPQAPQGQVLLVQQQPQLYYTTAPVLQPMHYMVQPPVQNTVLLAEAPRPNVQNVMLVKGPQSGPTQGLVMQGQTLVSGQPLVQGQTLVSGQTLVQGQPLVQGQTQGAGMVLVEKAQGPGASLSGSQVVLVEGKVPSGSKQKVLKSGLVQPGLSGSQTVLVVGSGSAQGQQPVALSSTKSGSQKVLVVGPHTSQGLEPGALSGSSGALTGSLTTLNNSNISTVTSSSSIGNTPGNSSHFGSRRVVQERVVRQ